MAILKLELQDLAATERFGQFLSKGLVASDVIALQGPLGARSEEHTSELQSR